MNFKSLFVVLFFFLSPQSYAQLGDSVGISPYRKWNTTESAHFKIHYPEEYRNSATDAVRVLETAHELMSKKMHWQPRLKTHITLVDNTDLANGFASPALRLGIFIYMTPPEVWMSTTYNENWFQLVLIHEYLHYLHIDPTEGINEVLRLLFGDLIKPNGLWQDWLIEGLAVYYETLLTSSGRGRSSYLQMILRSMVSEKKWDDLTIDKLVRGYPYFPSGEMVYLYGYGIIKEFMDDQSLDQMGKLSRKSSGRVPFFLNGATSSITGGKDWIDYFESWKNKVENFQSKQLKKLSSLSLSTTTPLSEPQLDALSLTLSSSGRTLGVYHYNLDEIPSQKFYRKTKDENWKEFDHYEKLLGSQGDFSKNDRYFLSYELYQHQNYSEFYDLTLYDLEEKELYRLTEGARAKNPIFSQDQRSIFYFQQKEEDYFLVQSDLVKEKRNFKLKNTRTLFSFPIYESGSDLTLHPEGNFLAFTYHPKKAQKMIALFDLKNKKIRFVIQDPAYHKNPTFSSRGHLYYISDRSGQDLLYRYDSKTQKSVVVATTKTGFSFPQIDPEEKNAFAFIFSSEGWIPSEIKISEYSSIPKIEPESSPQPEIQWPSQEKKYRFEERPYSSWDSLAPRAWYPLLYLSNSQSVVGAGIQGFDTLDFHNYQLLGSYDFETSLPDFSGVYQYRGFGPTLGVFYSLGTSERNQDSDEELYSFKRKNTFGGFVYFPFRTRFSTFTPVFSVEQEKESYFFHEPTTKTHQKVYSYEDELTLKAQFNYQTQRKSVLGIAPEQGRTIESTIENYRIPGNNSYPHNENYKLYLGYEEYLRLFSHVVLVPKLQGAIVNHKVYTLSDSNVVLENESFSLSSSSSDLILRGYPNRTFYAKSAGKASVDLFFPLLRIQRGWSMFPLYLKNLVSLSYVETSYIPEYAEPYRKLDAYGTGLSLGVQLFHVLPLNLTLQYQKGTNTSLGGNGEFLFTLQLPAFNFQVGAENSSLHSKDQKVGKIYE